MLSCSRHAPSPPNTHTHKSLASCQDVHDACFFSHLLAPGPLVRLKHHTFSLKRLKGEEQKWTWIGSSAGLWEMSLNTYTWLFSSAFQVHDLACSHLKLYPWPQKPCSWKVVPFHSRICLACSRLPSVCFFVHWILVVQAWRESPTAEFRFFRFYN